MIDLAGRCVDTLVLRSLWTGRRQARRKQAGAEKRTDEDDLLGDTSAAIISARTEWHMNGWPVLKCLWGCVSCIIFDFPFSSHPSRHVVFLILGCFICSNPSSGVVLWF